MDLRTILFSQYPALFLLALLFLIAHLRARKSSAVRSVLWVLLFGAALAMAVAFCFLGIQAELWTLKTIVRLRLWSWAGIALVLAILLLRVVHGVESRMNRRKLDRAMRQAEQEKQAEVARTRAEGAAEGAAQERERAAAFSAAAAQAAPFEAEPTVMPAEAEPTVTPAEAEPAAGPAEAPESAASPQ